MYKWVSMSKDESGGHSIKLSHFHNRMSHSESGKLMSESFITRTSE